jgi:hypothetical protein
LEKVLPGDIGASHLYIPIPDRETEAKLAEEAQLLGFQLPLQGPEELVEKDLYGDGFIFLNSDPSKTSSSDDSDDSDHFFTLR